MQDSQPVLGWQLSEAAGWLAEIQGGWTCNICSAHAVSIAGNAAGSSNGCNNHVKALSIHDMQHAHA